MNHKQIRNTLYASIALWVILLITISVASAALYNIINTDTFVNGVPSSLTVKERAKLITTTVAKTEQSCLAGKCELVNKAKAKVQIKAIIASEVCVAPQTGTWPDCVTPPPPTCPTGTTGTPPNCVVIPPVTDLMPYVDKTKNVVPAVGHSTLKIQTTGKMPNAPGDIAFRVFCGISHMNNDDPLVFPNQQNATHHHTYFGNTSVNYKSDLSNLANVGNSTCNGGIMNRSAYWHPSLIDENGVPIVPDTTDGKGVIFYYKAGFDGVRAEDIKPFPKGLKILAGNSKAKSVAEMKDTVYSCLKNSAGTNYATGSRSFPNCNVGDSLQMTVSFPRCHDGINLDSPNHQDHMSHAKNGSCPASHPVAYPQLTFNMRFLVTRQNQVKGWRLASDNYAFDGTNAGYSGHADYTAGWNDELQAALVKNCLNAKKDCGGDIIGDGRVYGR